ncbi:MAG: hypothetical protein R2795_10100 [Saprospiraceae bacterium]
MFSSSSTANGGCNPWTTGVNTGNDCDIKSRNEWVNALGALFAEYHNDQIVVFMHHPLQSYGERGGYFGWKKHLYPFPNLRVPLPVLGSLPLLYRSIDGSRQDIIHPHYQALVKALEECASQSGASLIFASAHDNTLQHIHQGNNHYIISGSWARQGPVSAHKQPAFATNSPGFWQLDFFKNGSVFATCHTLSHHRQIEKVYHQALFPPSEKFRQDTAVWPQPITFDTTLAPNPSFAAGRFKTWLWGAQYRDIWTTPHPFRPLLLPAEKGGLRPTKKGGGMASTTLRLKDTLGREYVLRSVEKDYRKLLPSEFAHIKVVELFQDQNSANHPYGALVVAPLAQAAGIFHTHPEVVYLPHQPALGSFNTGLREGLYLFEERPADEWQGTASFGAPSRIVGYTDLLPLLASRADHFVDQAWVCKSRLFDLIIHDWDRHDDQWRWAAIPQGATTLWRPIPRDRDQAFFKFKGLIPAYVATVVAPKLRTVRPNIRQVKHLAYNARHFDRFFLNALPKSEWMAAAEGLQQQLTDTAIQQAFSVLPPSLVAADELLPIVRHRVAHLPAIAQELYDFLAKEVAVVGTDSSDLFDIHMLASGLIDIRVYMQPSQGGAVLKYQRLFHPSETREVRLFGLADTDVFSLTGTHRTPIKLRIIGGEGIDSVLQHTSVKVRVYDTPSGIQVTGKPFADRRSLDAAVNAYDRYGYEYDRLKPHFATGFSRDDRWWLSTGVVWQTHAWRKDPFQSVQSLIMQAALGRNPALQLRYTGVFPGWKKWLDFVPKASWSMPRVINYFGTNNDLFDAQRSLAYNWVPIASHEVSPSLRVHNANRHLQLTTGPVWERHEVLTRQDNITQLMTADTRQARSFFGYHFLAEAGYIDPQVFPLYGFQLQGSFKHLFPTAHNKQVWQAGAQALAYLPLLQHPRTVLALRVGFDNIAGAPLFYQLPSAGNDTWLRGYRNQRFRGTSLRYINTDLRLELWNWDNPLLPLRFGITAGWDAAQVRLQPNTRTLPTQPRSRYLVQYGGLGGRASFLCLYSRREYAGATSGFWF